ncbi:MAG: DUF3365 domain-containing protein [Spirochaetales bacterium]|nr:DUF3365 domain-containing protein [Spirochaetales bacterium]
MVNGKKITKRTSLLVTAFAFITLFWTILMISFTLWTFINKNQENAALILLEARSFFTQLVTTREWNTTHGGVYVVMTKDTQPNPYLDDPQRDIVTIDGTALTLINPAYMTRQIAEIAALHDQIHFHITSLNPIRPENAAMEWEAMALKTFSKKSDEYYEWYTDPGVGKKKYFRYIAPLITETSCLVCHAKQGYVKGDVRGGISITIPVQNRIMGTGSYFVWQLIVYILLWIIGIFGIIFTYRLAQKEYKQRSELIQELQHTIKEVKTLKGFIPICASCKKVRNDAGYWNQIEQYIEEHSDIEFSHGICPDCMKRLYPDLSDGGELT